MKTSTKTILALGIGGLSIAGVVLQLTGIDIIGQLESGFYVVRNYLTSTEGMALFQAAYTTLMAFVLAANKTSQLTVANGQVQMMAYNNEVKALKEIVVAQGVLLSTLTADLKLSQTREDAIVDMLYAMVSGSRLSEPTRAMVQQRYQKLVKDIKPLPITDKRGKVVEQPVETIEQGLQFAKQVGDVVVNGVQTIASRMKQV